MQALLDEKDYDKITAEVLKRITKNLSWFQKKNKNQL